MRIKASFARTDIPYVLHPNSSALRLKISSRHSMPSQSSVTPVRIAYFQLYSVKTIERCVATDNPLFNGETGEVHHGGNFQAMAVTNAMEKTRLALHHIGKLLFAQATELLNPTMNRGLPPSLAASDPSLNYHGKGLDIAVAAYISELGFLANPVSTHIQSAEMHNQAVK
jgi:histidine ammonia-lyase